MTPRYEQLVDSLRRLDWAIHTAPIPHIDEHWVLRAVWEELRAVAQALERYVQETERRLDRLEHSAEGGHPMRSDSDRLQAVLNRVVMDMLTGPSAEKISGRVFELERALREAVSESLRAQLQAAEGHLEAIEDHRRPTTEASS